mmetsp:Transcript_1081/g.1530  ORF Transcript_1081/g.1530 Transcript_1081/m.1530 type:complete len:204 (+) Transcript_1081:76-687(+)|eukprot:CAMPEP_0185263252 /NCGR_PEP_ID=MMETSP1359-20130426/12908_1 /TAXON_ID=552665 /ORGANISM="Bigelowiella longifila, Strain CCMP242" /LENGTH=203 /DNA_ID=CAMNT_0027850585 /DNA_START=44 /DNA_END=655 /DNA_ORIENTATION=+
MPARTGRKRKLRVVSENVHESYDVEGGIKPYQEKDMDEEGHFRQMLKRVLTFDGVLYGTWFMEIFCSCMIGFYCMNLSVDLEQATCDYRWVDVFKWYGILSYVSAFCVVLLVAALYITPEWDTDDHVVAMGSCCTSVGALLALMFATLFVTLTDPKCTGEEIVERAWLAVGLLWTYSIFSCCLSVCCMGNAAAFLQRREYDKI